MRKADRLFQLINLIRSRQPITAEKMAEELGCSVRTIYRYIDDLSVSGVPVYGARGRGYRLHAGYELPPLNLTGEELDALMLGVRMVNSWTGDALSAPARSLANKIEAVVPAQLRERHSRRLFAPDFSNSTESKALWESVYHAVKNSYAIHIDYQASNGERTSRVIYPLGLFYWGGKWTIGSWCALRKDFRDFRLDRIDGFATEREPFPDDPSINLEAYLASVKK